MSSCTDRSCRYYPVFCAIALAVQVGCTSRSDLSGESGSGGGATRAASASGASGGGGGEPDRTAAVHAAKQKKEAAEQAARQREQRRAELLADARANLTAEQWDAAAESIDGLRKFLADSTSAESPVVRTPDSPSPDTMAPDTELAALESQLEDGRKKAAAKFRGESLARARQWIEVGKLDDAQRALSDVLTRAPTDEERQTAATLAEEIERRRKARRQLKSWMQLLASQVPSEVDTARTQLLQDPDTALGMVLEVLRETTEVERAANYVETLRQFDRAPTVLPALVELLQNEASRPIWPVLAREIPAFQSPGAGETLLDMAAKSTDAERRLMALTALAQIPDPPPATPAALGPRVAPQGAESAAALTAMSHAVRVHDLRDWTSLRGVPLAPERAVPTPGAPTETAGPIAPADAAIDRLREAVRELANPKDPAAVDPAVLDAARRLGAVTGLFQPSPLAGVKVLRAEAETPDGPAAAVLDGVWNSVDAKTMWRYPVNQRGSLLLDLGDERTVTAVRIWNWNESGGTQRGWKEVEVFVSVTPAELAPVATGIVPPAPGAADSPDYGALIPVTPTRGRYLRLQAKSNWTLESHSGLSEVQVIGF